MYDLVVIGAGSAGLVAAPFAASVGASVLLVEKDRIGGDCTWTGCVPSKALIHAAGIVQCLRESPALGIDTGAAAPDPIRVMAQVDAAVRRVYAYETPDALTRQGVEVVFGAARFVSPEAIEIEGRRITGRHFLVCTGAEPVVPPISGLAETPFYTYKDVFSLTALPRCLLIVGAGPVGVELAQAFRRLGSDVHLLDAADRLLPVAGAEASRILFDRFQQEAIEVHLGSTIERVEAGGGEVALVAGGSRIEGDALLLAVGRRPQLKPLQLDQAHVAWTEDGVTVDARLRTSNPRIFAAGDAAGSLQFTHYAGWQGYVAARNALLPGSTSGKRGGVPWVVFTDPEIGQVGETEEEASRRRGRVEVLHLSLERVDRAQTDQELDGFIELVARNGRVVGATVVAPVAGELINELALAIQSRTSLAELGSTIHVYPTYGIGIQQLASRASLAAFSRSWLARLLRGLRNR